MEFKKLSAAFELATFAKTYVQSKPTAVAQQIDTQVSSSVRFLIKFGLQYIRNAQKFGGTHFTKLCRNLIISMKNVMSKLIQDDEMLKSNVGPCSFWETGNQMTSDDSGFMDKCRDAMRINNKDRFHIMALIKFIVYGLGPLEHSRFKRDIKIFPLFLSFIEENNYAIQHMVSLY